MKHYLNDDRKLLMGIKASNTYIQVTDIWHLNESVYKYQVNKELIPEKHLEELREKIFNYNKIFLTQNFHYAQ